MTRAHCYEVQPFQVHDKLNMQYTLHSLPFFVQYSFLTIASLQAEDGLQAGIVA